MTLVDFLTQIAGGGAVGAIVAFLLEEVGLFQNLNSEAKKWIVLAAFLLFPLGATALLQFVPPDVWILMEPYWRAVAVGFAGWAASQAVHIYDKRKK